MRVVIVDDERLARDRLQRLLRADPEVTVIADCADGKETLAVLSSTDTDLLLLDVQMPEMDGFDLLRAVPHDRLPLVVFITAYDQYAIRAFEANAIDYLLKPFHRHRFIEAIERAKSQIRLLKRHREQVTAMLQEVRLPVPSSRGTMLVSSREVDWIEAANNYACLHCGVATHVIRETLNHLEQRLAGLRFARIHKSAMVNLDRVREIIPLTGGDSRLVLVDGTQLTVSRTYRRRLPW